MPAISLTAIAAITAMLLQASAPPADEPLALYTCGVPLPTAAEVEEYLRANWPEFERRLWPRPAAAG